MNYRVEISTTAMNALKSYVDHIATQQHSPLTAERWFHKAWEAVQSLKSFPQRCSLAPENDLFSFAVRMKLVDDCLFVFRIDEKSKTVQVLGFRHARQRLLKND